MFKRKKKDDAADQQRKQRKFLTEKFNASTKGGLFTGSVIATLCVPLAFVDGGVSLLVATYMASAGGGIIALFDKNAQKDTLFENECGQRIYSKIWVKRLQQRLQKDITKTYVDMNFAAKGTKKHAKLEKRKNELLEIAADLEGFMTVIDEYNKPTKQAVAYLTKTTSGDKETNKKFYIYPGLKSKQNSPKPPRQEG